MRISLSYPSNLRPICPVVINDMSQMFMFTIFMLAWGKVHVLNTCLKRLKGSSIAKKKDYMVHGSPQKYIPDTALPACTGVLRMARGGSPRLGGDLHHRIKFGRCPWSLITQHIVVFKLSLPYLQDTHFTSISIFPNPLSFTFSLKGLPDADIWNFCNAQVSLQGCCRWWIKTIITMMV